MLKDSLLNCLNELKLALETFVTRRWDCFDYFDSRLDERRVVCGRCGRTSSYTPNPLVARHQAWCEIAQAQKWTLEAQRFLGN